MPDRTALPFLVSGECRSDMGQLKDVLAAAGHPFDFVKRWPPPSIVFCKERFAGLIILGDSNHWATSKRYAHDRALLLAALNARRPVLGICFGAQLLAAHLAGITNGRSLARDPSQEHVGVLSSVAFRGEGMTDPVMEPLRQTPLAVMSHEDSFQAPATGDGHGLAWSVNTASEHCEAFRVGPPGVAVYGLQFHPEPTLTMLQDTRQGRRWFATIPDLAVLRRVQETGWLILEIWVRLAVERVQQAGSTT